MAKSKLKKQIKRLTSRISECEDYAVELEILIKSIKMGNINRQSQIDELKAQKCECESSSIKTIAKQVQNLEEKVYYLGEVTANFVEELRGKVKKLENHSCDTNQKAEFDKELFIDLFTKELIRECTCSVNGETMKDHLVNGESVEDVMKEIIAKTTAITVAGIAFNTASYTNTQKTDNISTAGQESGNLYYLSDEWLDMFEKISETKKSVLRTPLLRLVNADLIKSGWDGFVKKYANTGNNLSSLLPEYSKNIEFYDSQVVITPTSMFQANAMIHSKKIIGNLASEYFGGDIYIAIIKPGKFDKKNEFDSPQTIETIE